MRTIVQIINRRAHTPEEYIILPKHRHTQYGNIFGNSKNNRFKA